MSQHALKESAALPSPKIESSNKQCFVITPIGGDGTAERRATDGLLSSILRPVLGPMGYDTKASHEIEISGSISKEIIRRLISSDLVIANLTGLNPNVMYELAVRHAKRKPVIMLALHGTVLPFDIVQERTIFYRDDFQGGEELKAKLANAVGAIESGSKEHDNPIYSVVEEDLIRAKAQEGSVETLVLDKLTGIELRMGKLEKAQELKKFSSLAATSTIDDFYPKRVRLIGTIKDPGRLDTDLRIAGVAVLSREESEWVVLVNDGGAELRLEQLKVRSPNVITAMIDLY